MRQFSFDYDQLIEHVLDKRWRERKSWGRIAAEVGMSSAVLRYSIIGTNRPPGTRSIRMSTDTVVKLMMWLGDYDIRDYLIETDNEHGSVGNHIGDGIMEVG